MFEKFTQADATDRRLVGGTGLGLSISKQLIELMDGRLTFASAEGLGTVFCVDLPVQDTPPARTRPVAASAAAHHLA